MVIKNPSDLPPDYPLASEYGGVPGLIQPVPHDVQDYPREQLWQIYASDPAVGYVDGINPIDLQAIPETEPVKDPYK